MTPRTLQWPLTQDHEQAKEPPVDNVFPLAADSGIQSDLEMAKKLAEKKMPKYKDLPKQEIYQKLGGFLARKGFNWDTIKKAIDDALET